MRHVLSHLARCAGCLLAAASLACDSSSGSSLQSRRGAPALPPTPTSQVETVTVEFDAPPELAASAAAGGPQVTGFQVGFFGDLDTLVRTLDIPRSEATINGGTVRLKVPLITVQRNEAGSVSIRVRVLAGRALGAWSASAGSVTLRADAVGERRATGERRAAAAKADSSARLEVKNLDQLPELKAAVTSLLAGSSLDTAVASFTRLQDLALAVAVSRRSDLPFPQICEAMRSQPTFADALRALRPSLNVARELREARPIARELLKGAGKPKPSRRL